ncbi:hypothetical protein PASE110613_10770 [Paenibacillus sediminis]|uniref:ElaB/YqjD/DUF883 family membrane-anchored ribosome-binding protein n=1 Tax=Paenibacillus sediminis TaxID=664909 RepID=A0ABS4H4N5_9BACL|nr:hypothetical protein [Paenibacillus sediminis]MBP1937436.1 ElaB/YqjD/DUF883 family membrane-anchored ribosome-binding protein [Paenibacillus sediminis]
MFKRWRSEQGSVSIFLMMILAVVIAFVAVFIDYARITAFQVQSERLSHSSVRSVMSSYDPALQKKYGLFAFGSTDQNQLLAKILDDNVNLADRSDSLSIVNVSLDTSTINLERQLGNYDVFNQQIREEMKYKAPIDFTLELVQKFKPISQEMKEASNTVEVLKKLQKLYDEREELIDQMIADQRESAKSAEPLPLLVMDPKGESIGDESIGSISSASDIAAQHEDYISKVEADRDRDSEDQMYSSEISDYIFGSARLINRLQRASEDTANRHERLLNEAKELMDRVKKLNEEMKTIIADAEKREATQGYDAVSKADVPGSSLSPDSIGRANDMIKIRQMSEKLIISDTLLTQLEEGVSIQSQNYTSVNKGMMSVISESRSMSSISASAGSLKTSIVDTRKDLDQYLQQYAVSGPENVLDRTEKSLAAYRASDTERKSIEKTVKQKLKNVTNIISQLNKLQEKASAQWEEYTTLKQYDDEIVHFNKSTNTESSGTGVTEDPYEAGDEAMKSMDGLFGNMSSLLTGLGDELFQNEYATKYFSHFDFNSLLSTNASAASMKLSEQVVDQLGVQNQELEYILYGFHNPVGNIIAAYTEVFSTRLAIHTVEGLVMNLNKGNPLLILASALLYAVEKATEDMITLTKNGSVQFSKYIPFEVDYKDHLRFYLLIHSNNEYKMSRMLALIRFNTGINPAERGTYASSEIRTSIKLWFLPGIFKTFSSIGALPGEVKGNRYYSTKQVYFSY